MATILGTAGEDVLSGEVYKPGDLIDGLGGNDTIIGYHPDTILGGDGDDVISFAIGAGVGVSVTIAGGAGNDTIDASGSATRSLITGGDGDDTITVTNGQVDAGAGNDSVYLLHPVGDHFRMRGGDGYDVLYTGYGEVFFRHTGFELVVQTAAVAQGSNHRADAWSGDGSDQVMYGLGLSDTIAGGGGNDTIYGGARGDVLSGGDGDDRLYGECGGDTLTGGDGADQFVASFNTGQQLGRDVVTDWQDGIDLIRVEVADATFGDLIITAHGNGVLVDFSGLVASGGSMLVQGVSALDAGDVIFA